MGDDVCHFKIQVGRRPRTDDRGPTADDQL